MSVSPTMVTSNSPKALNDQKLKQARLSLPAVSDRSHAGQRMPNSMPGSQDSTPIGVNAKIAMHFEGSAEVVTAGAGQNQAMSLP